MKVLGAVQVTYPCHKDIMFSLTILLNAIRKEIRPIGTVVSTWSC